MAMQEVDKAAPSRDEASDDPVVTSLESNGTSASANASDNGRGACVAFIRNRPRVFALASVSLVILLAVTISLSIATSGKSKSSNSSVSSQQNEASFGGFGGFSGGGLGGFKDEPLNEESGSSQPSPSSSTNIIDLLDDFLGRTKSPTSAPSDGVPTKATSATRAPRTQTTSSPTKSPTDAPTNAPTKGPTKVPTKGPTKAPTYAPTRPPSRAPTEFPTKAPTITLTKPPTKPPTRQPTKPPTQNPTKSPFNTNRPTPPTLAITFNPGDLTVSQNGLLLSTGLTSRIMAVKEQPVQYTTSGGVGGQSSIDFHLNPDAGATYADERAGNEGGWIYVSNSEIRENTQQGGVGAFTFDKDGNVIDYRMVLTKTRANCGGGRTPWGAWVSCEEVANIGQNWQVDPTGVRQSSVPITLGIDGGQFESFAYDIRNLDEPHFYVTEDTIAGALQRFTPDSPNWNDPWGILYGGGTTDFLLLYPVAYGSDGYAVRGVFSWTTNRDGAKENAERFYPNTEGIDVAEHELFFVSKRFKTMYVLNLDDLTYTNSTTRSGLFDGQPDQLQRILGDDSNDLLYFTEDGGRDPGIHCRNEVGQFFTLLESPVYEDESTGLAFSPDGMHLYFALQETGLLYDVTRTDLLPFQAKSLNVKFHATNGF